ncbi:alpha/beta fold hydrolase [Saccharomonospora sp. NPDC006951]
MIDFGGSGPQLLLLHGLGGSAEDWREFAACLTDTHRVLAADLGAELPWPWAIALADLEALDLDNPAVLGMSFGGMIAGRWAARHPECPTAISIDGHRGGRLWYCSRQGTGVERDLLAAANPNLTITKVDGTHGMVTAQPATVAAIVRQFLPPPRKEH